MTARVIAIQLTAWRARMGLTSAQAAARLHVSQRSLEGWQAGRPCAMAGALLRLMWREEGSDPDTEPGVRPRRRHATQKSL